MYEHYFQQWPRLELDPLALSPLFEASVKARWYPQSWDTTSSVSPARYVESLAEGKSQVPVRQYHIRLLGKDQLMLKPE